jgi:hypothetical protein
MQSASRAANPPVVNVRNHKRMADLGKFAGFTAQADLVLVSRGLPRIRRGQNQTFDERYAGGAVTNSWTTPAPPLSRARYWS